MSKLTKFTPDKLNLNIHSIQISRFLLGWMLLPLLVCLSQNVEALEKPGEELNAIGVDVTLGTTLDGTTPFSDSNGVIRPLSDFLKSAPATLIVPAYYGCPRQCGLLQNGVAELINSIALKLGTDYNVLTVSFDETDTPKIAKARSESFRKKVTKAGVAPEGWEFLTGGLDSINQLMGSLGFRFRRDGADFAHTSAVYVLSKEGRVSQYFTGIEFPEWDVKMAIVDASQGRVGNAIDHILLYCFRFDPTKGKYTWAALGLMRVVATLTLIGLVGVIGTQLVRERRKLTKA
jgi:protein SCO1